MDIPLPIGGYWSKIKAGKKVLVKSLPKEYNGKQQIKLSLRIKDPNADTTVLSAQSMLQNAIENDPLLDLNVKEAITNPDPLVISARKALSKKNEYYKIGDLLSTGQRELDIKVAPENVERALRLMDTFIKAMQQRGHNFKINDEGSYIVLGGADMEIALRETQTKVVIKDHRERTEFHVTGILSLRFKRFSTSVSCTDGKVPIEQQFSKIIAKLELLGERFKLERAENEKWHREYKEKQRVEQELANRKKMELSSFKQLLQDSYRWKETIQIREYIDHIEQKASAGGNLQEDLIIWLDWARKKADWYDPLINSPDEWLNEADLNNLLQQNENANKSSVYNQNALNNGQLSRKESWPLLPWYLKK